MNKQPDLPKEEISKDAFRRRTFLSFGIFLLADVLGWSIFRSVKNAPRDSGAQKPLRSVLTQNEKIFSSVFSENKLAKEYPVSEAAKIVRVNGLEGLHTSVDQSMWRLNVMKASGEALPVSMDELKKLPKKDVVFEFKCIEGWSQIMHWGGVPFAAFMDAYGLNAEKRANYIGLQTVDKKYYVGIDMASALHPQTLLSYEMNGQPLSQKHGAPLRLIIPVKYGIKHLKQIGTLFFSNSKPPDYWAERGYDYYAGH